MFYAQGDSNGNIIAFYSDEFSYPNGIPNTAIQITDAQWKSCVASPGAYTIKNNQLVAAPGPTLAQAQQAKIAQLRQSYSATLASGFKATIGGVQYTFGWTTDDKANLDITQTSVDRGDLTFPIKYSDINGNPVTLSSQSDLDVIEQTATRFMSGQHQQVLTFVGQAQSAASVDTVNAIQWQAATY